MRLDISEQQFLELLRAGLWEGKVNPALFEQADWERMMTVAEHQTMTGVVGEAMMSLPDDLVPVEWKMKTVARLVGIEDMNSRMNDFLPVLFKKLRSQGWNVWLLKGQGVGRCYPHAQRRQPGDIDVFFTNEKEYHDACKFFKKHLRPQDIKAESDEMVMKEEGRAVPDWDSVVLPPCRFDAVFIFLHTVRHYFGGGIGLRQVADWMRYIYTNREEIDNERLAEDIRLLGLEKIWKVFGCMAVHYLGYPQEYMPLYDKKYQKEGGLVLRYILDSGNFGYYDARTKTRSKSYLVQRWKAFSGHLQMKLRNFRMFPEESVYGIPSFIIDGLRRAAQRK